jgi:hypothetical protein
VPVAEQVSVGVVVREQVVPAVRHRRGQRVERNHDFPDRVGYWAARGGAGEHGHGPGEDVEDVQVLPLGLIQPERAADGRRKFQDMRIAVTLVIAALTAALGVTGAAAR